jgi:hypothetical protein
VTAPPVGGVGTVTAAKSNIGASAVVIFTLVVRVSVSTPAGTEIANTATVSADNDSDPGNDSATAHTTTRQPLAVALVRLTAKRRPAGVVVRWRTGAEIDVLGFALYRRGGGSGRRLRLGRRLIPALGPVSGRSYSYLDRRAPRHRVLRYWLRDVARNGRRTWHGPVRVPGA